MGPIIGCHPVPRLQLVLSFGHGETIMAISTKEALGAANKTFLFFQFPTVSLL